MGGTHNLPLAARIVRTLGVVSAEDDIRAFLSSRRARITPDQAGLTAYGRNRRVPGLRHEEVAMLAGISVEYYTQLERGNARGASDDVLAGSPTPCNSTTTNGATSRTSSAPRRPRHAPRVDGAPTGSVPECRTSSTQ